jgi:hypothetical protein
MIIAKCVPRLQTSMMGCGSALVGVNSLPTIVKYSCKKKFPSGASIENSPSMSQVLPLFPYSNE